MLTRISTTKKGVVHEEIDHNFLLTEFDELEEKLVVAALQLSLRNMKKLIVSSISQ